MTKIQNVEKKPVKGSWMYVSNSNFAENVIDQSVNDDPIDSIAIFDGLFWKIAITEINAGTVVTTAGRYIGIESAWLNTREEAQLDVKLYYGFYAMDQKFQLRPTNALMVFKPKEEENNFHDILRQEASYKIIQAILENEYGPYAHGKKLLYQDKEPKRDANGFFTFPFARVFWPVKRIIEIEDIFAGRHDKNNKGYWYIEAAPKELLFYIFEEGKETVTLILDFEETPSGLVISYGSAGDEPRAFVSVMNREHRVTLSTLTDNSVIKEGLFRGVELNQQALREIESHISNPNSKGYRILNPRHFYPNEDRRWFKDFLNDVYRKEERPFGEPESYFYELALLLDQCNILPKNFRSKIRNLIGTKHFIA